MNFTRRSNHRGALGRQKGIATILIVTMIGIALTSGLYSYIHALRGTQEKQLALHASTHTQNGVWAGVEAFRRYLGGLQSSDLEALRLVLAGDPALEYSISFGSGDPYGSLMAKNFNITLDGDIYRFSADIVNLHEAAQSSSAVGVMYEIRPGCSGCVELSNSLDFFDDLNVTGGISMLTSDGRRPNVNVNGNVTINNVTINNMGRIAATGNVTLGSQVTADHIYSNGNVLITGGAVVQKVEARGTVGTDGGSGAVNIWANGDVTLNGSVRSDAVNSRAKITARVGAHGLLKGGGDVILEHQASGTYGNIMSAGNIIINRHVTVGDVIGEKNFTCYSSDWRLFNSISVQGLLTPCVQDTLLAEGKTAINQNNTVDVMREIQPFGMPRTVVDVWALRSKANYILEWDTVARRIKVTVQHVHGQIDGEEFHVADYSLYDKSTKQSWLDYLCKSYSRIDGKCTEPATPAMPICLGYSTGNNCVTYDLVSNTFTFAGTATVPGIIWVAGNLKLNGGYSYSTFLATGNITTGSSQTVKAANYSGYDEICLATGAGIDSKIRSIYNERFKVYYPTQLCSEVPGGSYTAIPTGNLALAAGGYDPAGNGTFSGGNIGLDSAINIYGTVLAGNFLQTAGDTQIFGYVMAAGQSDAVLALTADRNKIGASTIIDLRNPPVDYDPTKVPDMGGGPCIGCGGQGGGTTERSRLLWSRYL